MIVRVPASSANLGPGFDALGVALGLWHHPKLNGPGETFECVAAEPDGFAYLDLATNAGVRAAPSDALLEDLRKNRGYLIVTEGDAKDANGNAGKEVVLETTVNGRPVRELLTLFVPEE